MANVAVEHLTRQAENLPLPDKRDDLPRQLDWQGLYGLGKGLWADEDAQEYINRLREDRL